MTIDKRMNYVMQGGQKQARNYLGKQKTVSNVPIKWKSGPNAPETELAYITKAEKDLLIKKDLHGSLKNGPNTGPDGVMSLDSQGDYSPDRSGRTSTGNPNQDRANEAQMRAILTGQIDKGQTSAVSVRVRQGAVPEYVNTPDGMKYVGSAYKDTGKRGFLSKLFGGANRYGYAPIQGLGSIDFRQYPTGQGGYYSEDENVGDIKPGYGGRILGGLGSILTGMPFIGGALGSAINKFKPKSYWDKMDPSEQRRLNALNITPYNEQKISLQNDMPMASINRWTQPINQVDYNDSNYPGIENANFISDYNYPGIENANFISDYNYEGMNDDAQYNINRNWNNPMGAADGGRVGYKTGGRVGILSVF